MPRKRATPILVLLTLGLGLACSAPAEPVVESTETGRRIELSLQSLTGARDGGTLRAAVHLNGADGDLTLRMAFQLGVPTTLTSGTYQGQVSGESVAGAVQARSVTFLGGQSDRPSLGGSFSLLGGDGIERFRFKLPTSPVQRATEPKNGDGG